MSGILDDRRKLFPANRPACNPLVSGQLFAVSRSLSVIRFLARKSRDQKRAIEKNFGYDRNDRVRVFCPPLMSNISPLAVPTLPEIITTDFLLVPDDTSLGETIDLLNREEGKSSVLVRGKEGFAGIVSEKALLKAIAGERNWREMSIGEIADRSSVTLTYTGTENALSVWTLARRHGLSRLPVVDEKGELLGIVTAENLLRAIDPVAFAGESDNSPDRSVLESIEPRGRSLYDNVSCGYHCLDGEGFIVEMNDTELKSLGYTREEIIGRHITDFLPQEGRESFERNFPAFKERGWINNVDHPIYRKDGSILFQNLSAEAVYDDAGNFLRSRSVVIDVTEYKRLERTLRDSEARLQDILNSEIIAITSFRVFADRDWEYEYYSAGCEALFGYTADEFLADKTLWISSVIPLEGDNLFERLFEAFFAEQSTTAEYRFCCKDGSLRWFYSTYASRKAEEGYWRITAINTDITDRVLAENAKRESEQTLSLAMKCARAGSWNWEISTGELVWSPETYRLYGLDPDEDFPRYGDWYNNLLHPDDRQRMNEYITRAIERRLPDIEIEFRVLHPRLGVRWLLSLGRLILNEQGEPTRVSGINLDITDRVTAETRLREREEFLSGIYHGANQAIFVIEVAENGDFRYLDFNRVAERGTGVSNRDIRGKTPEEVFGTEIGTAFRQNYDRCLQSGTSVTYEELVVFADREIWTLTTLSPLRDDRGKIARIVGTSLDITDRVQARARRQRQLEQQQLIAEITNYIRQSLDVNEVLQRTVDRVRRLLASDRVIIFRFGPDWRGEVVVESVASGWEPILSTEIFDPCFGDRYAEPYRQGRVWAVEDIRAIDSDPCYLELLEQFQVRANLVVPIRQGENLWGLLIAHHCSGPRRWTPDESDLLRQLALQVGIAVQQSELYQNTHRELLERQQIQNALQESEERFRSLCASAPIGIYLTDADGINLYANERLREMLDSSDIESIGDDWVQTIHPDDRSAVFAGWQAMLRGEGAPVPEFRMVTPSGGTRYVTSRIAPIRSASGEAIGYVGTAIDISDRVRAENALRESELRYANLAEASPVAIFRFDTSGHCVYVNRRWCEMNGRSAESALGTGWVDTIHPDALDRTLRAWERWFSGDRERPFQIESHTLRQDGSILWYFCQIVAETAENGAIIGYVGSLTDISDRVRAESALRESERKLQSILDHSPAAIYVTDRENRLLLANRRYAALLSTTVDAPIGKSIHEYWPAKIAATFAENNQKVWETGRLLQSEEVAPHPDGLHTYLTVKFPLLDGDGEPYAVCGISTDITEKKRLEEQFYRTQRLESLGTLASGIAHDLNNVFTPILAIARILPSELPHVSESTRQLLEMLEGSARQGAEMIREILLFSRGGDGNRVTLSVIPLLSETIRVARNTFPKTVEISFSRPEGGVWPVSGDPTRLQQVVMNLLVNARDAMPDGGKLTLRVRNARIDERFARVNLDARPGSYVSIAVSDTGTGIPRERIDRIFDPFFTTKEPGKGTGLGLSSVLGIVRDHGGFVRVSSRVGKGSRLTVYLPALSGENLASP